MRILAAIDLGATGHEQVAAWAGVLGDRADALVDLLYVCSPGDAPEVVAARRADLEAHMAAWSPGRRGQAVIETGPAIERILSVSETYDALVVGPRARSTWQRLILGEVAAQIVRKARCPVFVCRAGPLPAGPRVLVGIDVRRGNTEPMIALAARWAARLGGTLHALYVDTAVAPPSLDAGEERAAAAEQEASRTRLRRTLAQGLAGVPAARRGEVAVVEGASPGEKLVEVSEHYDLVLVGSLERVSFVEHLLGSVAEQVVSRANSNVLAFPAPGGAATTP